MRSTGNCLAVRKQMITEKECCCSAGGGWGKLCTPCPKPGSGKDRFFYFNIMSYNIIIIIIVYV